MNPPKRKARSARAMPAAMGKSRFEKENFLSKRLRIWKKKRSKSRK